MPLFFCSFPVRSALFLRSLPCPFFNSFLLFALLFSFAHFVFRWFSPFIFSRPVPLSFFPPFLFLCFPLCILLFYRRQFVFFMVGGGVDDSGGVGDGGAGGVPCLPRRGVDGGCCGPCFSLSCWI